jgi:hypothetical protein
VRAFIASHPRQGSTFIVPVAVDPAAMKPPEPIALLKAALYDGSAASLERVAHAAGCFLGLSLRREEQRVFIAYRSTDGGVIARDLHARLSAAGFAAWLDEASDNLPVGIDVQSRIHQQLEQAAILLTVDTPDAPTSEWIKEEIDAALGEMIPVLPVVTGPDRDISRFMALTPLQRRAAVKPDGPDGLPLSDEEFARVHREVEGLLLAAYRRRLKVTTNAQQAFHRHGFSWQSLDERRRVFEARRTKAGKRPGKVVLAHCSIHDATYVPALRVYGEYLARYPRIAEVNEKLCVYERDRVLSAAEESMIWQGMDGVPPFTLAHYNELGILIQSNFTQLS